MYAERTGARHEADINREDGGMTQAPRGTGHDTRRRPERRMYALLAAAVLALIVTGCFDYREEIWLNKDLSGRIKMHFVVPEFFVTMSEQAGRTDTIFSAEGIRNRFGAVPGITVVSAESDTSDANRVIDFELEFDSLEAFERISNAKKETNFLGEITINRTEKGNVSFSRTISLADSLMQSVTMYDEMLNKRFWVTRIHFPGHVLSTNAPDSNVDPETGNTVTWAYSIAVLTKGHRTMYAVYSAPSPRRYIYMGLSALVFFAVFAALYKALGPVGAPPVRKGTPPERTG